MVTRFIFYFVQSQADGMEMRLPCDVCACVSIPSSRECTCMLPIIYMSELLGAGDLLRPDDAGVTVGSIPGPAFVLVVVVLLLVVEDPGTGLQQVLLGVGTGVAHSGHRIPGTPIPGTELH